MTRALLSVRNLAVSFAVDERLVQVLDAISLEVARFESIAIIGESGSGKSVLGHSILRLLDETALVTGEVWLEDLNLCAADEGTLRRIRGSRLALIPQNAAMAFDPVQKVGSQLIEIATKNGVAPKDAAKARAIEVLVQVGFEHPQSIYEAYPHRLSGGMRGRALIAMSLMSNPDLIIADEPTKGLDAVAKESVMKSLLQSARQRALLLITHDLQAAVCCERAMVLYGGQIVEDGSARIILNEPRHPYTQGLLRAQPSRGFKPIPGSFRWNESSQPGCRFRARCPKAEGICNSVPALRNCGGEGLVRCHLA